MLGEAPSGNLGSNSISFSIGIENKLLLQKKQKYVAVAWNHIAGICLAIMLLTHQTKCLDGALQTAAFTQKHAVDEQVKWLMGAPAGDSRICSDSLPHAHSAHSTPRLPQEQC